MYTCEGDSIFFKTNFYTNLNWYINENDFDEIYSGEELITEPIYNDTSFLFLNYPIHHVILLGLIFFLLTDLHLLITPILLFDVYQKMTLKSVDVKATGNLDRIMLY